MAKQNKQEMAEQKFCVFAFVSITCIMCVCVLLINPFHLVVGGAVAPKKQFEEKIAKKKRYKWVKSDELRRNTPPPQPYTHTHTPTHPAKSAYPGLHNNPGCAAAWSQYSFEKIAIF